MRKVSQEKGAVSMENTNYTAAEIVNMGKVFFFGATGPEFEALPEDPSLLDMLSSMAEIFEDLNEKKVRETVVAARAFTIDRAKWLMLKSN